MTPTPTRLLSLYSVRHGQTEWSLSGQHTGSTDIPLTAHGEAEARKLRPWLKRVRFGLVLASPRQRARRTCELVGLGREAEIEPDLAELDYGDYEGKLSSDICQGRPDWNVFRDGCPHGEMPTEVSNRADRLIARLCTMNGNIALFSHGEFGPALAARWIGLPVAEGQHLPLGTASLISSAIIPLTRKSGCCAVERHASTVCEQRLDQQPNSVTHSCMYLTHVV